ncbi:hypothetical protein [Limisphaera sp. 4302-co]|uniref:hypothetical protein n=1 Tax=Limisphaera sp. 4302-co TaxID=3400417 RepID=UPI003C2C94CD
MRSPGPGLTPLRSGAALLIALIADAVQIGLGPLGVAWVDDLLDVVVAVLEVALLGFHPLLLPTFVLEVLPVIEFLPTWTGCVLAVIAMRRQTARRHHPKGPRPVRNGGQPQGPVIDI